MLKNCVFKGTEQRVKKVPFQYHFTTQEYHFVQFLPGFHYPGSFSRIRAYSNQVTSLGTRPVFAVNAHLVPKWRWILSGTGEKTFYPRSNLKNDLWRYIVHRKVMIRWKRFWKKQSSQHRRWLLSVFSCKLRLCLIIIGVVCGKKILKLPVLIKRHVKLLCRWNMFSIILQFPEQIYRCIQERIQNIISIVCRRKTSCFLLFTGIFWAVLAVIMRCIRLPIRQSDSGWSECGKKKCIQKTICEQKNGYCPKFCEKSL